MELEREGEREITKGGERKKSLQGDDMVARGRTCNAGPPTWICVLSIPIGETRERIFENGFLDLLQSKNCERIVSQF